MSYSARKLVRSRVLWDMMPGDRIECAVPGQGTRNEIIKIVSDYGKRHGITFAIVPGRSGWIVIQRTFEAPLATSRAKG